MCLLKLLDAGADVNSVCETDGNTPLHWAAVNQNFSVARKLLENGCKVFPNNRGKTAFDMLEDQVTRRQLEEGDSTLLISPFGFWRTLPGCVKGYEIYWEHTEIRQCRLGSVSRIAAMEEFLVHCGG